ncbi:MAG: hypothetical protein DWQ04_00845 [Chloroflexi bacterium]|nr:MAG: hypothetical protein DWQ04_00845 [Chloroflexota bacterium]
MMPYQINVDHDRKIIFVSLKGRVSFEDLTGHCQELLEEPYLTLSYGIVVDYLEGSLADVKPFEVRVIAELLSSQGDRIPDFNLAILVSSKLEFGFNRMFEALTDLYIPWQVLVTYDQEKAYAWAGEAGRQK